MVHKYEGFADFNIKIDTTCKKMLKFAAESIQYKKVT